jgi:hypothetical protein
VRTGERQVTLQQLANVTGSRIVNRDLALRHSRNLRGPRSATRPKTRQRPAR